MLFWKSRPCLGMSQPRHVCFYSNRCDWSKGFIRELQATPYLNEFKFVCVDPSPNRPKLPSFLKKVPTLVIAGESEPRTDAEVMNWLSQRRLSEKPLPSQAPRTAPAQASPSQVRQSMPEEPMEWNSMEMGGVGQDPYSFLDQDTSTAGNGGMRIQHSFEYLAGGAAIGTAAAGPSGGGGQPKSKKEELFDKQMESYQRERENGMPQMRPRQ
jgi:hypothetical protein